MNQTKTKPVRTGSNTFYIEMWIQVMICHMIRDDVGM